MRFALPVLAVCAFVLVGCATTPTGTNRTSKAVICGKALGSVALTEITDDAQRRARHTRETADLLRSLAAQTDDRTLADALRAAAAQARADIGRDWTVARARAEKARFDAVSRACS